MLSKTKSFAFALRMVNVASYLERERKEFVLSRQMLRSGTTIGALVREGSMLKERPISSTR
jgi:four helix bundle protein